MTFEQALEYKQTLKSPYLHKDVIMKIFVAPEQVKDFERYCRFYLTNKVTDDTAKIFSLNGKFKVYGFGPRDTYFFYEELKPKT